MRRTALVGVLCLLWAGLGIAREVHATHFQVEHAGQGGVHAEMSAEGVNVCNLEGDATSVSAANANALHWCNSIVGDVLVDVDHVDPGYVSHALSNVSVIVGGLTFKSSSQTGVLGHVNFLRNLTSVSGALTLDEVVIVDTWGFGALTQVGGVFVTVHRDASEFAMTVELPALTALTPLTHAVLQVTGNASVDVSFAPALNMTSQQALRIELAEGGQLANGDALNTLVEISTLTVKRMHMTFNLAWLSGLTRLRVLNLSAVFGITDLTGLTALTRVESLSISRCPQLRTVHGLESLGSATVLIKECDALTSVAGLASLTSTAGIRIDGGAFTSLVWPLLSNVARGANVALTNLPDLTAVEMACWNISLSALTLINLPKLTRLSGLSGLTEVTSELTIANTALTALNFTQLALVAPLAAIHVWGLPRLVSLDLGFRPAQTATLTSFMLDDVPELRWLRGVEGISYITDTLRIENTGLTSLTGFTMLLRADTVEVRDNANLTTVVFPLLDNTRWLILKSPVLHANTSANTTTPFLWLSTHEEAKEAKATAAHKRQQAPPKQWQAAQQQSAHTLASALALGEGLGGPSPYSPLTNVTMLRFRNVDNAWIMAPSLTSLNLCALECIGRVWFDTPALSCRGVFDALYTWRSFAAAPRVRCNAALDAPVCHGPAVCSSPYAYDVNSLSSSAAVIPSSSSTGGGNPNANGHWSEWGACSKSCGGGVRVRTCEGRMGNGSWCVVGGDGVNTTGVCNTHVCPGSPGSGWPQVPCTQTLLELLATAASASASASSSNPHAPLSTHMTVSCPGDCPGVGKFTPWPPGAGLNEWHATKAEWYMVNSEICAVAYHTTHRKGGAVTLRLQANLVAAPLDPAQAQVRGLAARLMQVHGGPAAAAGSVSLAAAVARVPYPSSPVLFTVEGDVPSAPHHPGFLARELPQPLEQTEAVSEALLRLVHANANANANADADANHSDGTARHPAHGRHQQAALHRVLRPLATR